MAFGGAHRNVAELLAATSAAEHQAAAAHVSSSRKFGREEQPVSEDLQQRLNIFCRGDAAQENDLAAASHVLGKQPRITLEGDAVARLRDGHRRGGDSAQRFSG